MPHDFTKYHEDGWIGASGPEECDATISRVSFLYPEEDSTSFLPNLVPVYPRL
jgi:hypothetical protein